MHLAAVLTPDLFKDAFLEASPNLPSRDVMERRRALSKQIASLPWRFFDLQQRKFLSFALIDAEFDCAADMPGTLISHNINSRFFTHVHRMGSVAFAMDAGGLPSEMLAKSFLDMIENARMRWFGLMFSREPLIIAFRSENELSFDSGGSRKRRHTSMVRRGLRGPIRAKENRS